MKITELELNHLTVFEAAELAFAPGVNVFIGENGTGKSHVLKALYALLRTADGRTLTESEVAGDLAKRLAAIFRPDDEQVGRLVRAGAQDCKIWLRGDRGETYCTIPEMGAVQASMHRWEQAADALFLPSREVLAMFEGFTAAYQDRELSFDETYYDVCIALTRAPLRGDARQAADLLALPLRKLLTGNVVLRGNRFYVDLGDGPREAHLNAEGFRKLATLAYLIQNGSIRPGSILLWDEPEANLSPSLLPSLAEVLCKLAANDVQVFLATHDYLLSQRLSLAGEYHLDPEVAMRFFSFSHERPTDPVKVESADTLAEIQHNPILSAYARYYEYERQLFRDEGEGEEEGHAS